MNPSQTPDVETLRSDPAYRLVMEIGFSEMIPFVMAQIRKRGVMTWIYITSNVCMLGALLYIILSGSLNGSLTWSGALLQSLAGIVAGSFAIIPFHEMLHGLAYRILGAKKISFGVDFQQLIFFVTADRYPVSGRQLIFLALTPFVLINLAILMITVFFIPKILLFSCFLLLIHNMMCIGDFAIAGYVHRSGVRVYSYDEPGEKRSYFFEDVKQQDSPANLHGTG